MVRMITNIVKHQPLAGPKRISVKDWLPTPHLRKSHPLPSGCLLPERADPSTGFLAWKKEPISAQERIWRSASRRGKMTSPPWSVSVRRWFTLYSYQLFRPHESERRAKLEGWVTGTFAVRLVGGGGWRVEGLYGGFAFGEGDVLS
jgi:hypothetical protein